MRVIEIIRRSGGAASAAASADRAETAANDAETALASLLASNKLETWKGQWLTSTVYVVGDLVYQAGSTYICRTNHTSGVFATDLGAVKWALFAQQGTAGGGTGDMLKADNLTGLTSLSTSQTNLGIADKITKPGDIIFTIGSQSRAGAVKVNGATLNRGTYASLWTYAQASGRLAASEGAKTKGEFGPGDGSTTFTLPDMRGYFPRFWDDGAGVDSGRALGSVQAAAMLNHTHTGTTSSNGSHTHTINDVVTGFGASSGLGAVGSQAPISSYDGMTTAGAHTHTMTTGNPSAGGGTETRPTNINIMAWMVY